MEVATAPEAPAQATPAAGQGQASAPNGAAAPIQVTDSGAAAAQAMDWMSTLNDETKGYVQNKGFKDPSAVLDSYRNLEKLLGAPKERLLKLPEKEDDPGWKEVYSKLGAPADPKEYNIKIPEGVGDEKFATWAKSMFHELGIPKRQGEKLAEKWSEYIVGKATADREAYSQTIQKEEQSLKQEWGAAFEQNVKIGKHAVKELGIKNEWIDAFEQAAGFAETIKFLHMLGTKIGEAQFVEGSGSQNGFGVMTPQQAQSRIQALRQDSDFVKRYTNGDVNARLEMERLHQWAYPSA